MVNQTEKIKTLFTDPASFFKSVAKENKYFPILLYFVVIFVIGQLIQAIFSLPASIKNMVALDVGGPILAVIFVIGFLIGLVISVVIAFIAPFIGSAINHLGVLIVGGKNGFFNTFKPSTYAAVIGVIYGVLSSLILSVLNIVSPVDMASIQAFSLQNLPILSIVVAIIIGLAAFIHTMYAEVVGISQFQKISRGKALIAVLILPILMILLIALIGVGLGVMKGMITGMGVLG